jgi:outer membrane immunogenic protein
VNWIASVTGRLGYTQNNWLLYVKGGGAWADFDQTAAYPAVATTISNTRSGWTAGAGLEYAFTPGWSAKVEYQYYDFGSDRYNYTFAAPAGVVFPADIDSQIHTVKVGLNWRFGGLGGGY